MFGKAAPTDQRAGVRPIAFVLQSGITFGSPVILKIRPEDLTRTEPSRVSVHQTLGRVVNGWVDNFGEGLPSLTIAGTTGWRTSAGSGEDGAQAFERLNSLIAHDYHAAKQAAIDSGTDPATVKLLFIDMLDGFSWSVAPTSFVLRRSKSRPLLFQYNIQLQAVATDLDIGIQTPPDRGNVPSGLRALGGVTQLLDKLLISGRIKAAVSQAVALKDNALVQAPAVASQISEFVGNARDVFQLVQEEVAAINGLVTGGAGYLVGIATDIAGFGAKIFRTVSAIAGIPGHIMSELGRVASAFHEAYCIFRNALRPRKSYFDFRDLYGASNCSSTTGGLPPSVYANQNPFSLMQPAQPPVVLGSEAQASIGAMTSSDPVFRPMGIPELSRHVGVLNEGMSLKKQPESVKPATGQKSSSVPKQSVPGKALPDRLQGF